MEAVWTWKQQGTETCPCACQLWHLTRQRGDLSPVVHLCFPPLQPHVSPRQGCQVTFGSMSLLLCCCTPSGHASCSWSMCTQCTSLQYLQNFFPEEETMVLMELEEATHVKPCPTAPIPQYGTRLRPIPMPAPWGSCPEFLWVCRKTISFQKLCNHNRSGWSTLFHSLVSSLEEQPSDVSLGMSFL